MLSNQNMAVLTQSVWPAKFQIHVPHEEYHMLAVMPFDDVNTKIASDENIAACKTSSCPAKVLKHMAVVVFQVLAVPSSDDVSTRQLSCENTAVTAQLPWPTHVIRHAPDVALHIFAVESCDAVSTRRPSGENVASFKPGRKWSVCPDSFDTHESVLRFQMLPEHVSKHTAVAACQSSTTFGT